MPKWPQLIIPLLFALTAADHDVAFGGTVTVVQTTEWSHFRLIGLADAYNLATLQLQSNYQQTASWPMFLMRKGLQPTASPGQLPVADLTDMNAYTSKKLNHYLSFPASLWSSADPTYLSVYISAIGNAEWTYSLTIATSSSGLCPGNCFNNGSCMNGKCNCIPRFVDVDCSVEAVQLQDYVKTVKVSNASALYTYVKWADGKK